MGRTERVRRRANVFGCREGWGSTGRAEVGETAHYALSGGLAGHRILVRMAGKQDKAAAKEASATRRAERKAKRGQIFEAFKMQRREDKALLPIMIGVFLAPVVVAFVAGLFFHLQWALLPLGAILGVLLAVIVFGRRVQRSVYTKAEGQPGAAGWALDNMRGRWNLTQAVAGTTQLDAVHRLIGRPGIVLVAEGAPHRVKTLLAQEKKRVCPATSRPRRSTRWKPASRRWPAGVRRCRRGRCRRARRSATCSAPSVVDRTVVDGTQLTRTIVPAALSCRPRWSPSQITAGTIRATSRARAAARHGGSVG